MSHGQVPYTPRHQHETYVAKTQVLLEAIKFTIQVTKSYSISQVYFPVLHMLM